MEEDQLHASDLEVLGFSVRGLWYRSLSWWAEAGGGGKQLGLQQAAGELSGLTLMCSCISSPRLRLAATNRGQNSDMHPICDPWQHRLGIPTSSAQTGPADRRNSALLCPVKVVAHWKPLVGPTAYGPRNESKSFDALGTDEGPAGPT